MNKHETPAISVRPMRGYPIIRMEWARKVTEHDVRDAFQQITALLDESTTPLYVLVDITVRPNFPLYTTAVGALQGPHNHPQLAEWLVIGKGNRMGQIISDVISARSKRTNIRWFDDEVQALAYLAEQDNSDQSMIA